MKTQHKKSKITMTQAISNIIKTYRKRMIEKYEFRYKENLHFWIKLPMVIKGRKEKDEIILSTIQHLEDNIKIN